MATDRGLPSVPRGLERGLTQYLQAFDATVRRLSGAVRGSGKSRAVRASEASAFGGGSGGGGGSSSNVDIGAIASQVLRDGSVTERKIADNAVSGRKLGNGTVTADKLGENSVTASAIAPGEVISNALAQGAVTTGKIAPSAVTSSAIAQGAVTTSAIAQGAVTSDKIAAGVIPVIPEMPEIPVLPVFVSGEANNGDTVTIPGTWTVQPQVMLTWFETVAEEIITEKIGENGEIVPFPLHTSRAGAINMRQKDNEPEVWIFDAVGRFTWVAVCQS